MSTFFGKEITMVYGELTHKNYRIALFYDVFIYVRTSTYLYCIVLD